MIPLNTEVLEVLRGQQLGSDGCEKGHEDRVFTNEADEAVKNIRTAWEVTVERAGS